MWSQRTSSGPELRAPNPDDQMRQMLNTPYTSLPDSVERIDFRAWMKEQRELTRLRIKGPIAGRLYVCYTLAKPGRTATAMTPEAAYNAWHSYWGGRP